MYILLGIIFLGVGLLMAVSPSTFFQITERWKSDGSKEPSELYKIGTRIEGGKLMDTALTIENNITTFCLLKSPSAALSSIAVALSTLYDILYPAFKFYPLHQNEIVNLNKMR